MSRIEERTKCNLHGLDKKFIKKSDSTSELICHRCVLQFSGASSQSTYVALDRNSILLFKEWTK